MAKSTSKSKQGYYQQYKVTSRWASNRKLKLERALKRNPGNSEQIKLAIGNISYRRQDRKTRVWSHSMRALAKIFKKFTDKAPVELFSANSKVRDKALEAQLEAGRKTTAKSVVHKKKSAEVSFSIGARVHDGKGNFVWK